MKTVGIAKFWASGEMGSLSGLTMTLNLGGRSLKRIALGTLTFLVAATGVFAASPEHCTLRIHATGFRNQKGEADGVIFKSPDGWPENPHKAFTSDAVPIDGNQATLTFHLPPGEYGIAVLHDENKNHKVDRDLLGIPKEGFGFANNPHVFFSAPSFKAATVNVGCPATNINVKMIYK
jgi:uncharacterized protein (DUF2141 family)